MFQLNFATTSITEITQTAAQKLSTQLADWEKNVWQFIIDWNDTSINSIEVFTSGSTGEPQKIFHKKEHVIASAKNTCKALALQNGCTALLCLPANKISGIMMLVRSMVHPMNLICIKPSATPLSDLKGVSKIDFAAFTPMQLFDIVENDTIGQKAEEIQTIILGGESIQPELKAKLEYLKNNLYLTFGMTETISHIALKKVNEPAKSAFYKLLPNIKIETDNRNCLVIKAPQLGQPFLITNDVVHIISETEFDWLGRFDNVINSGGIKLYPEKIEEFLKADIKYPFLITGIKATKTGEQIALLIEKNAITEIELSTLKNILLKLDTISRPKKLFILAHFERTENGKIVRNKTLEQINESEDIIY